MSEYPRVTAVRFSAASRRDVRSGLLGFASFEFAGFRFDGVAVRRTRDGRLVLSFPERTDKYGKRHETARPVDAASRKSIESAVFVALHLDRDRDEARR